MSDRTLLQYPIIVVGKWAGTPFKDQRRVEEDTEYWFELRTDLIIERVIKGDIAPGTYPLLLVGYSRCYWSAKGGVIHTGTSSEMVGDAPVQESNLWFLTRRRSWNPKDGQMYLAIEHYRAVQPLSLEPYFKALGSRDPDDEVCRLLSSDEPLMIKRCLRHMCGGVLPGADFPFPDWYGPKQEWDPLVARAETVSGLLVNKNAEIRGMAARVYAKLAGENSVGRIRPLLRDDDPSVRGIAIICLAQNDDADSVSNMIESVNGIEEPSGACELIAALEKWGREDSVPAVIAFLQNDRYCGGQCDIPAIQAQRALQKITGHIFPFDVAASRAAWQKAKAIQDHEARMVFLEKHLHYDESPIEARLVNDRGKPEIAVTNVSGKNLTILRIPSRSDYSGERGGGGGVTMWDVKGKEDFVQIDPGGSFKFDFPVELDEWFLYSEPRSREVVLRYLRNGNEFGLSAWMGKISATVGPGWIDQPRTVKSVEEQWPNGRVRCKGQTLNGKKHGVWTYWDQDGNRTEEVEYFQDAVVRSGP